MAEVNVDVAKQTTSEEINEKTGKIIEKLGEQGNDISLLNSTLTSNNPVALDILLLQAIIGDVFEYTAVGTYMLQIPANINKIKVTACGGGGGGGKADTMNSYTAFGGGGGGGGDAIQEVEYAVTPQSQLPITVGAGGISNGGTGGVTIVGNLVTLAGGNGGTIGTNDNPNGVGGLGSGNGGNGGAGATFQKNAGQATYTSSAGTNGLTGNGGSGVCFTVNGFGASDGSAGAFGGGGGGSLGNGGSGQTPKAAGTTPTKGGGGGGGSYWYDGISGRGYSGKPGADGYVKITWGY